MIGTLTTAAAALALFLAGADQPGSVKALIVTGANEASHNWKETTTAIQEILKSDPRYEVRVVEDPAFLESPALAGYHVVILNFADPGPAAGDKARTNLQQVVESGRGLVVLHHASSAWDEAPDFAKLAGRTWKEGVSGFDPKGGFRVEVLKTENPIVKGLEPYETNDEIYYSLEGDQAIEVLATAKSKITGRDEPMAFIFPLGKGRVFHLTLGHDAPALQVPGTAEMLRRGTAWAAGQETLTPAPAPQPVQAQAAPQPAAS